MCERCIDCSRDIAVCKHGNCEQLSESFIKHTHANTHTHAQSYTLCSISRWFQGCNWLQLRVHLIRFPLQTARWIKAPSRASFDFITVNGVWLWTQCHKQTGERESVIGGEGVWQREWQEVPAQSEKRGTPPACGLRLLIKFHFEHIINEAGSLIPGGPLLVCFPSVPFTPQRNQSKSNAFTAQKYETFINAKLHCAARK